MLSPIATFSSPSASAVNLSSQLSPAGAAPASSLAEALVMVERAQPTAPFNDVCSFYTASERSAQKWTFPDNPLAHLDNKMLARGKIPPPPGSLRYEKTYGPAAHKLGLRGGSDKDAKKAEEAKRKEEERARKEEEKKAEQERRLKEIIDRVERTNIPFI